MEGFIWETAEELDLKLAQRVRNIRKHLLHYLDAIEGSRVVLTEICQTRDADKQMALVETFFEECFR